MTASEILVVIAGPTLFWAGYHYCRDRHRPEPFWALLLAYLLGIGSGYLGTLAYQGMELLGLRYDAVQLAEQNLLHLFAYSVLGIGLVEETVKILPFIVIIRWLPHFDDPLDGITYAAFIGLGFASFENYHYGEYFSGMLLLARGVASPMIHVAFASIWGYTVGRAVMTGRSLLPAILAGLGLAVLAHGIYDFIALGLGPLARLLAAGLILIVWLWRMRLIAHWHRRYSG
jgi:RsiW-degrading membrane proteinase PrsW (M82 family)